DIDDSSDPSAQTVTTFTSNGFHTISGLAPASINIEDQELNQLNIHGGSGGNTFNVFDTVTGGGNILIDFSAGTYLFTGTGDDTVNIHHTEERGTLIVEGVSGHDRVNIGDNGHTQGIAGFVILSNDGSFTSLNVDDSADTVARNVTMTDNHISGLTGDEISFEAGDTQFISVRAGSGGNTFDVEDTFKNGSFGLTSIDTG